uniref:Uncharacterized protein n=1 Tax=viral metagenome TaxID=1070528 RepID=A0A6H2A186_9ZZZZ
MKATQPTPLPRYIPCPMCQRQMYLVRGIYLCQSGSECGYTHRARRHRKMAHKA